MMKEKPWLSKLLPFARNEIQWEAFTALLESYIEMNHRKLEGSSDMPDVYRAQGAIAVVKQLKQLKDEIYAKAKNAS